MALALGLAGLAGGKASAASYDLCVSDTTGFGVSALYVQIGSQMFRFSSGSPDLKCQPSTATGSVAAGRNYELTSACAAPNPDVTAERTAPLRILFEAYEYELDRKMVTGFRCRQV